MIGREREECEAVLERGLGTCEALVAIEAHYILDQHEVIVIAVGPLSLGGNPSFPR
jgi:hypothetical protein